MYKPSLSQTIQNTYFRFPDDGSQKQKVPKKQRQASSSAISFHFRLSSTYCPQQARQQKGYQLQVSDSVGTILPQIVFPICISAQLVPQQAKLLRIQSFGSDVGYHLFRRQIVRYNLHVLNLVPYAQDPYSQSPRLLR
jgi:hypothetical protein